MDQIIKGLYILAAVWIAEVFLFNVLVENLPHLPGDIFLDHIGLKVYIPVSSAIVISIIISSFVNKLIG